MNMKTIRGVLAKIYRSIVPRDTQTPVHKFDQGMILASFPKSGRTWLRVMLNQLGIEIPITHDGSAHVLAIPYQKLIKNKRKYKNVKLIFLVRDPRDVVVSGFFQASKRTKVYERSIAEFIRDPRHGIQKILTFYNIWDRNKHKAAGFHLLRYEDLKKNTFVELKRAVEFLDVDGIDDKAIEGAVEFGSFENMQKREKEGYFKEKYGRGLTPGDKNDTESFKVRKGKVGGYTEYLSDEDVEYCNEMIRKLGNPFYPGE